MHKKKKCKQKYNHDKKKNTENSCHKHDIELISMVFIQIYF